VDSEHNKLHLLSELTNLNSLCSGPNNLNNNLLDSSLSKRISLDSSLWASNKLNQCLEAANKLNLLVVSSEAELLLPEVFLGEEELDSLLELAGKILVNLHKILRVLDYLELSHQLEACSAKTHLLHLEVGGSSVAELLRHSLRRYLDQGALLQLRNQLQLDYLVLNP